jgi:hypothetical protein
VSVLGRTYELEQGFLAGRVVDIVYSYLDDPPRPDVEHEDKRYSLALVDPIKNARRTRPLRHPDAGERSESVSFDPSCTTEASVCTDDEEDDDALF